MAKPWQYPRWRRLLMQGVMWLILAGTVGLAALVNHQIRQSLHIELSDEVQYDNIVARLPVGWETGAAGAAPSGATLVQARETGPAARSLSIERHRVDALISPEEFLFRDPLLAELFSKQMLSLSPAVLADQPAILVAAQFHWSPGRDMSIETPGASNREPRKLLRICTVLPSRQAIVVQLEGPGTLTENDVALATRIAGTMQVTAQPWLDDSARSLEFSDGTIAAVPNGYRAVVDNDPNRISRWLLRAGEDGSWACAELIPCLYADSAAGVGEQDSTETLRTLLLPHGDEWRDARVTRESPSQPIWRITPKEPGDFAHRAYLITGGQPPGRALLVLFRAGLGSAPLIESAWQEIRRGVRFDAPVDLAPLVQSGAEQARRIRGLGLADRISSRGPQWWLWYKDSADTFVGSSHIEYDPRDKWRVTSESLWTRPDGSVSEQLHRFDSDPSMRKYDSLLQRFDTDVRVGRSEVKALERALEVDQGQIRVYMERNRSGWQGAEPPNYLPGGWLGELMGEFRDQTVLLRTDTLTGCEDFAPAAPMTVLVRPTADEELPPQDRQKWPWCMTVQVNGAGEVMRWHFSAEGRLEQIDQADGVHRIRSDQATIESFTHAPRGPDVEKQ